MMVMVFHRCSGVFELAIIESGRSAKRAEIPTVFDFPL
jgi:hypothetical protein